MTRLGRTARATSSAYRERFPGASSEPGAAAGKRPCAVKRIFDPVHHFIELSTAEARLLDLPAMQRLRRLRQLGLAYLAFPSAEHSRFTHALGALAMGTRAFDELARTAASSFADDAERRVPAAPRSRRAAAARRRARPLQPRVRSGAGRSPRGAHAPNCSRCPTCARGIGRTRRRSAATCSGLILGDRQSRYPGSCANW